MIIQLLNKKPVPTKGYYKVKVTEIIKEGLDKTIYPDTLILAPINKVKFLSDEEVEVEDSLFSEITSRGNEFYAIL